MTFYACSSLSSVEISKGVLTIGDNVFEYCGSLKNVVLPKSVARVGRGAFSQCKELKSVTIVNESADIAEGAFSGCSGELTIRAKMGSLAHRYAAEHALRVEPI